MQENHAEKVVDDSSDDDIAALLENVSESPHTALRSLLRNAFSRIADAEFSRDNAVRLLCDGPANYPVWLAAIAEAKRVVHLENYIIDDDAVGRQFADALMRASARGVKCRVLYDWLGCGIRTPRRFWRMLRDGGVEVRCYNPPRLLTPVAWISRDHRKLLTVDGAVAFAGGLCISKHWAPDPERNRAAWRDTALEIRGPAVRHLEAAFADSWAAAGAPLPPEDLPQDLPVAANEDAAEDAATPTVPIGDVPPSQSTDFIGPLDLWVVAGRPDNMGLYRLQQMIASTVKHRLWLADAYFVATTGYVNTLTDAARAGVDVRLLVPGSSDVPMIKALSLAEYRPLLEAGVRVFEWNGPMMHAKTTVADSCWARVGSSNSNLASWISNRELDITIDDRVFARAMEAMYLRDLRNCTEIVLQAGKVRPGGGYVAQEEEEADLPPAPATAQTTSWSQAGRNPIGRGGQRANAGRLLAGTIGAGSSIGASISQHRALTPTESRVLAVGGLVLVALGLVAIFAPKLIAYPLAVIAAWLGIALLLRAWRLRFPNRSSQGGLPEGRLPEGRLPEGKLPDGRSVQERNHVYGKDRTQTGDRGF